MFFALFMDSNVTSASICLFVLLMRFLETEVALDVRRDVTDVDDEVEFPDYFELSCDEGEPKSTNFS